jgi:hypothetical protein
MAAIIAVINKNQTIYAPFTKGEGNPSPELVVRQFNEMLSNEWLATQVVTGDNSVKSFEEKGLEFKFLSNPNIAEAYVFDVSANKWAYIDVEAYRKRVNRFNPVRMVNGFPTIYENALFANDYVLALNQQVINRDPFEYQMWFRAIGQLLPYHMNVRVNEFDAWWEIMKPYYADVNVVDGVATVSDGTWLQDKADLTFQLANYETMWAIANKEIQDHALREFPDLADTYCTIKNMSCLVQISQEAKREYFEA